MVERQTQNSELLYREETRRICERIVDFVNPKSRTPVRWERGRGWFWNFKDNYIVMDENDLEKKSREYCIGVALHEALHVWMSRTEFFSDEEWQQLGFAIGFNFAEDCGIENAAERVHRDGKELIKSHLDVDVAAGGGLDINIAKTIDKSLGYIPKHMILGGVMRQYFHGRQIAGTLNEDNKVGTYAVDPYTTVDQNKLDAFNKKVEEVDPDVKAAFDQIRPLLEKFWEAVPEMYDNEEEIREFADERAKVYREIWDIYKTLVEQSVEDQSLKDFVDHLIEGGQFTSVPMPGGGQAIVIDFGSLPPEVQKELIDLMQDQQDQAQQGQPQAGQGQPGAGQPGQSGGQPGAGSPSGENQQSGEAGESSEQSGETDDQASEPGEQSQGAQSGSQPSKAGTAGEGAEGEPSEEGQGGKQVPWDKVSPEAKQKIKEQYDQVQEDQKEEIKKNAEQELGEVEDEVNDKLEGKSDKEGVSRPTKLGKKKEDGEDGDKGKKGGQQGEQSGENQQSSETGESGEQSSESGEQGDQQSQSSSDQPPQAGESKSASSPTSATDEGEFKRTGEGTSADGQKSSKPPEQPQYDTSASRDEEKQLERFYNNFEMDTSGLTRFDHVANEPELREASDILRFRLEPIFRPNQEPQRIYGDEGGQVDIDRILDFMLGNTEDREFMYNEERPLRMNYRFTILVDLSSSMTNKLEEVFKMLVILSENLAYLGIEFQVEGFTDDLNPDGSVMKVYKPYEENRDFGENLSDDAKNRIGSMMDEDLNGTPTARALFESFQNLQKRNQETATTGRKIDILMVLTDGQPTDYMQGSNLSSSELLREVVSQVRSDALNEQMLLAVLGLGIGPGTHFVNDVFPALPFGLRNEIANELNNYYYRKGVTGQSGYTEATAEDIGNSFIDTYELTVILPVMFEYIIKNPGEFSQ